MKRSIALKRCMTIVPALGMFLCAGTVHARAIVTAQPPAASRCSEVTVTGQHFTPGSPVEVFLKWRRCSASTDDRGRFSCTFKVPKLIASGAQNIWTVNRSSGRWVSTPFVVGDTVAEWPQYRYSARREGAHPHETSLSASSVGDLSQRWSFPTSGVVHNSVSVVGGIAYFGSFDGYLYAVDAGTGQQIWRVRPVPPGPHCCGTLMNTGSPAIANGKVYIGTIDHYFYAFDQATGRQLWGVDTHDDLEAISPTVIGKLVYIGGGCPEAGCFNGLRALNSETGAEIWKRRLDSGLSTGATVAGGVVYAGSGTGRVYALDAQTGEVIWQTQAGTRPLTLAAALSGERLYVGSGGGRLYAIEVANGAIAWTAPLPDDNYGAPAVQDGAVYIGGGNALFAFDAESGNALWSADLGGQVIWSSPTVANGVVYSGSNGGGIVAVAAADGRRLWSALPGQTVHSAPTIVDGAVYLGSENGRIYAFDLAARP